MKAVARATEAARSPGGTPCRPCCKEKPRLGSRTTIRLGAAKRRTMIQSGCEGAEVSGDSAQSPSPEKTKSARPAIRNERMADLAPVNGTHQPVALACCEAGTADLVGACACPGSSVLPDFDVCERGIDNG